MIKAIYFLIILLLLPIAILVFLVVPRGRQGLLERLGIWSNSLEEDREYIWVHGASLGEVRGLIPVVNGLSKIAPNKEIIATATTTTAQEYLDNHKIKAHLLPFDLSLLYKRVFGKAKIKLCIISETELWPGMLWFLNSYKIPVVIINARISDASWSWYKKLGWLFVPLLNQSQKILVADKNSFERYKEMGVVSYKLELSGNTKYDFEPTVIGKDNAEVLKKGFFKEKNYILTLGSMRPGEEKVWFDALMKAEDKGYLKDLGIVVAPRHPEKFGYFESALKDYNLSFDKWSDISTSSPTTKSIVLLDTLGFLEKAYSFTDLAFIGGTLEDLGGHNPLEAAAYGAAVVMGPSVFTVIDVVKDLLKVGGLLRIQDAEEAFKLIEKFILNPSLIKKVGLQSLLGWQNMRGANGRALNVISDILKEN